MVSVQNDYNTVFFLYSEFNFERVQVKGCNGENVSDEPSSKSLSSAVRAFTLIRSSQTKLAVCVNMRMRIDEPAFLTSVKVTALKKDFGIF
jgi:hypothetical protein